MLAVLRVFGVSDATGGGEPVANEGGSVAFIFTEMPDPALMSKYNAGDPGHPGRGPGFLIRSLILSGHECFNLLRSHPASDNCNRTLFRCIRGRRRKMKGRGRGRVGVFPISESKWSVVPRPSRSGDAGDNQIQIFLSCSQDPAFPNPMAPEAGQRDLCRAEYATRIAKSRTLAK